MLKHFIFFGLLIFIGATSFAQERLSLEQAIAKSLEYNYDIRIADVDAMQATVNNTKGNAGMLPNVDAIANVNTARPNIHNEFADGRVQEVNNAKQLSYGGGINVDWTLYNGGRMFYVKRQLGVQEGISKVQVKEQIQATVSQVIQAYAQVVWQQQQGVAIDTGLSLAKVRMLLSLVKYETGISAKVDYLQARVDYNSRRHDSLNQIALLNAAFANLNALMGVDPYRTYDVDDSLKLNTTLKPTNQERLEETNLTLDIARRNIEVSRLNERIAKSYQLPTVVMNTAYLYSYSKSNAGLSLFNRSYGPSGGLTFGVPIYQGGNLRRQVKIAALQTMREQLLYDQQNTELGRQYRTAWRNYKISIGSYQLEQENIVYAQENMEIQRARFRVGIATTLETREAENSYVQALVRYYTAAYTLKVNETRVLELENELVK